MPAELTISPDTGLPRIGPTDAAPLLENLGFRALSDLPDRPGPALLAVAIRPVPTLHHFDPETIDYWVNDGGKGARRRVDGRTPMPLDRPFSWGQIAITDRLRVTNEYLSFGGWLAVDRVDTTVIATFTSPAPILCRGGHSQGWDHGAELLGAFFGRFLLAVDYRPGFEARAAGEDPLTLYAAFLIDTMTRYRSCPELRDGHPDLWLLIHGAADKIRRTRPAAWASGQDVRDEMCSACPTNGRECA